MRYFDTLNQSFRQLLGNGLRYQVPPFQRDYAWTTAEWEDLWQDCLALFEADAEPAHYMGYIVLQPSGDKRFHIIDGQQRITTLSLLVLAALAQLEQLIKADLDAAHNRQRQEQLRSSYLGYLDPVSLCQISKNT